MMRLQILISSERILFFLGHMVDVGEFETVSRPIIMFVWSF